MNEREKEIKNMYETVEGNFHLNDDTDLVDSPDDGGWYIHDFEGDRASAIYSTRGEAIDAYVTDSVEWETK